MGPTQPSGSVPTVVGYYTVNTPYVQEAETLKLSLDALGYTHDIRGVPNLGSWQKNTQYKARFLSDRLAAYPLGTPLLYLDVDSIVVRPLEVLRGLRCDLAAVHFHDTTELLSGTLYLGNTQACRDMVKHWIALNEKYPTQLPDGRDAWDQRTLQMAIDGTPGFRFVELPQEYTWITELTQRRMPNLCPVIIHTRGAFRFKRIVGA